jgi:hypothetical protein
VNAPWDALSRAVLCARSTDRPTLEVRTFPGREALRSRATRTTLGFWIRPSFKDRFLSPRAKPCRYDSLFHRCMRAGGALRAHSELAG